MYFANYASPNSYTVSLTNAIVANNQAIAGTPGTKGTGGGGGIVVQGLQMNATNLTVAQNALIGTDLVAGTALLEMASLDGINGVPGKVSLKYSIISDHPNSGYSRAVVVQKKSSITLDYVLFSNNSTSSLSRDTNEDGFPLGYGTFTWVHPKITASSVGFVSPGSPNYNYHLKGGSAAIDKAVGEGLSMDIDKAWRPDNRISDLGADEYNSGHPPSVRSIFLPLVRR